MEATTEPTENGDAPAVLAPAKAEASFKLLKYATVCASNNNRFVLSLAPRLEKQKLTRK